MTRLASSNDNVGIDGINCSFECGVRFVARAAPEPPVGLPVEFVTDSARVVFALRTCVGGLRELGREDVGRHDLGCCAEEVLVGRQVRAVTVYVAEESDVGVGQSREASASRDHQNRTAPALRLRRSGAVRRSPLWESNRRPHHVGFASIA